MHRADAGAGQHGKGGFGNHRHVDQHAVALLDAQRLQAGGHALHFAVQVLEGVGFLEAGFAGDGNQRGLAGPVRQMPVHGVVAQVGLAAFVPFDKRRVVVVADAVKGLVPLDQAGLLGPEGVGLVDGLAIEVCIACHGSSPDFCCGG